MNNVLTMEKRGALALGGIALGFRSFFQAVIDMPELLSSGWLGLAAGLVMALPAGLLLKGLRTLYPDKRPEEALPHAVGKWGARGVCFVLMLLMWYDSAFVLRALTGSATGISINEIPVTSLLIVTAVVLTLGCMLGGGPISGTARIWIKIFLAIAALVGIVQLPRYTVGWLTPLLGPGARTILQSGWHLSGLLMQAFLLWLLLEPSEDKDGWLPVRAMVYGGGAAILAAFLYGMLTPAMPGMPASRVFRLDSLLSNGRLPLSLHMPLMVIWYGGLLMTAAFDLLAASRAYADCLSAHAERRLRGDFGRYYAGLCAAGRSGTGGYGGIAGGLRADFGRDTFGGSAGGMDPEEEKEMKKWAALLLLPLLLAGCSPVMQIDQQIYAVSMSLDATEEGGVRIAAQMPVVGGSVKAGEQNKGGEYTIASADGAGFPEALDVMQATLQRHLNLSQLKTVVFSEELASQPRFKDLLREIVLTHELYNAAQCIVTTTEAKKFIEEQNPVLGARLSSALTTTLKHHQELGYSPQASLADVFYSMESIYGSGIAILAATSGEEKESVQDDSLGEMLPGTLPRTGDNKNEYVGAALIGEDRMVGVLTGAQNQLLMLLDGQVKEINYVFQDTPLQIRRQNVPIVKIDLSGEAPVIYVTMALSAVSPDKQPDVNQLARELQEKYERLTAYCQSLEVDPFGYAGRAAAQFRTMEEWLAYDWREKFPRAQVEYTIKVFRAGS